MSVLPVKQWELARASRFVEFVRRSMVDGVSGAELLAPKLDAASWESGGPDAAASLRRTAYALTRAVQATEPPWDPLSFNGSWASADTAIWFAPGGRVDALGQTELRGAFKHATTGTTGHALTMPAELWPTRSVRVIAPAGTGAAVLTISGNGGIYVDAYLGGGSATQIDLTGVRFSRDL